MPSRAFRVSRLLCVGVRLSKEVSALRLISLSDIIDIDLSEIYLIFFIPFYYHIILTCFWYFYILLCFSTNLFTQCPEPVAPLILHVVSLFKKSILLETQKYRKSWKLLFTGKLIEDAIHQGSHAANGAWAPHVWPCGSFASPLHAYIYNSS